MKIWKYLGWDTKEARTERNKDNNYHSTIQTAMVCVVLAVGLYSCSQVL
jgi:hypothetical protein